MTTRAAERERRAVVYGVVRFVPGGDRQVLDIVITFPTAAAADVFATERGWSDYMIAPARFFVHERRSGMDALAPPDRPELRPFGPDPLPDRPPTGGPALSKQGHRPASADPAGPPGSAGAEKHEPALAKAAEGNTGPAPRGEPESAPSGVPESAPSGVPESAPSGVPEPARSADPGLGTAGGDDPDGPLPVMGSSGDPASRPRATVRHWGGHRWSIRVTLGSRPIDLLRAAARLPVDLTHTASFCDADTALVYGGPPAGALPVLPSAPATVAESLLAPRTPPEIQTARWMTPGELQAYRAGHDAALDGVRRALA
ncbi:hypothetical protein MXD95_018410 [Frankia sp. AiPa1]|nr:hypothetical protein [Frankia sp. AiPa1]